MLISYRTVRLLLGAENRRRGADSKMEKARLRESVLLEVHPDDGQQLWHELHLSGAEGETRCEQGNRMRALRLSRLLWLMYLDLLSYLPTLSVHSFT